MNRRMIFFLLFVIAGFSCVLHAEKIDEIKRYFELRDTLSLVNLEMKRALAPDSRSPMLVEADAEMNLTRLVMFLEERVKEFAQLKTPLKQHYVRNLNSLFIETRYLYANVLVKIRSKPVNQLPVAKTPPANVPVETQERPYFKTIDLRTLLSPPLLNDKDLKRAESVWANQMSPKDSELFKKTPVENSTAVSLQPEPNNNDTPGKAQVVAPIAPAAPAAPTTPTTPVMPVESDKSDNLPDEKSIEPRSDKKPAENSPKIVPPPTQNEITSAVKNQAPVPVSPRVASSTAPIAAPIPATISIAPVKPVIASGPISVIEPVAVSTSAASGSNIATAADILPVSAVASASFLRPLAVMIENHRKARPQSGLIAAEIVYEMPVEGGITRFMALFFHVPGILGPVRSCREYFVDRAMEVAALYVHCGGSPKGYAYLSKTGINSIDEIKHGKPFYRDKSRKAPHNLYTKGQSLVSYLEKSVAMKLAQKQVPLNYGAVPSVGQQPGTELYIRYHGNYNTAYKYVDGVYERYMNGVKHVDRESGKVIAPKTVILQTANMKTVDSVGRQEISFVGSGTAMIFYRGKLIQARWQKTTAKAMTDYIDSSGNKVVFDRSSPVWIQVVSPNLKMKINGVDPDEKKENAAEPAVNEEAKRKAASEKS